MTPDAIAADSAFLTIDQAVANLDAADIEREEDKSPAEAETPEGTNTEADPAAEDASEPEAVTDGDDAETEDAEAAEEAKLPAIEPPRFWDAEAKARFGDLPRDLQELVLAKETERDKATAKSLEETALSRKAADGEVSRTTQLNGILTQFLPQAIETFKSKWENVDWNAVVDQYGAGEALKLRNQYERETASLQQLRWAKQQADSIEIAQLRHAEDAKLRNVIPDLADPKRRTDLDKFVLDLGIPQDALNRSTATELSLAYDAMRWRQAQAKAKEQASAPKTPAKTATPNKPSVKSTAAPGRSGSPQQARIQALSRKPSLTTDELVELMDLQET